MGDAHGVSSTAVRSTYVRLAATVAHVKSLLGAIVNQAPVPYVQRGAPSLLYPVQTGPPMNAETQLRAMGGVGTLFAIVSTLANSTGAANWRLWKKAFSGLPEDRTEIQSHAALDIWNKPNPFMTRQEYVESVQQHVDLTGEGWMAISRNPAMRSLPLELWPMRPDRVSPVPSPQDYLQGYVYAAPDGQRVPLQLDEVIQLRMPNPMDPYRGMGPVQSILVDIDSTRYGAEWNRNFFRNSAVPGGVIEREAELGEMGDEEWKQFTKRWRESHQGVHNAHRVAMLPAGSKWVDRAFSQRDMQFAELSKVSRDIIREAFGIHGHKLGMSESVNRANADAADVTYARDKVIPRLERFKQALNNDFLPMFGGTTVGLEFDYDNPVPEDYELAAKLLTARANAAVTLVGAGFSAPDVLTVCELPDMAFAKPEPKPVVLPPGDNQAKGDEPKALFAWAERLPVAAAPDPDLTPVQEQWLAAIDDAMAHWPGITAAQREQLHGQIELAIDNGELAALGTLAVSSHDAAVLIERVLSELATTAGAQVAAEAAEQDVTLHGVLPAAGVLAATAAVVAGLLAASLAATAGREALRIQRPGSRGKDVAREVDTYLKTLSDQGPRTEIGAALTGAQNSARLATFVAGPEASLYASEVLDKNTCKFCKAVDGRFLGNTTDGQITESVMKTYPMGALGGYVDCLGRMRCRGTITGRWVSKTAKEDG